jgi:hypothetical protein
MDQFIYETKIKLDYNYLKSLALIPTDLAVRYNNSKIEHHRLVEKDQYMTSIRHKLPFLSAKYNVYKTSEMRPIPLHIDAERNAAFNIPILNTEKSSTIFYEKSEELELEYVPDRLYNLVKSKINEVFRFTLLTPTVINNSVPHKVVTRSMEPRIIISWSISKEYSFFEAVEMFKEYEKKCSLME